jgi:hypothetical protein
MLVKCWNNHLPVGSGRRCQKMVRKIRFQFKFHLFFSLWHSVIDSGSVALQLNHSVLQDYYKAQKFYSTTYTKKSRLSFSCNYVSFFVVWTQGLAFSRQVLYLLSHAPSLFFALLIFHPKNKVKFSYLWLPRSWDHRRAPPHPICWLRWGFINVLCGWSS